MLIEKPTGMTHDVYKVGGALPWDSPMYVHRQADTELNQGIASGKFCTVLGPKCIGKSSLRVQAQHRLTQMGYRCVTIYATELLDSPQTYYRWDKQLVSLLWDSLHPKSPSVLQQWLKETSHLLPQERLERIAGELLKDLLTTGPVVIFIDAAEALIDIPFLANDLCDWIWHCQCLRKIYPIYQNLRFVMLGSALPTQLIQNEDLLANGCEISLKNFELTETPPLQRGFANQIAQPQKLLEAILRWTNGQPILTQKLCQLIKTLMHEFNDTAAPIEPITPLAEAIDQWIDHLVQSHIIANWKHQDELSHLWSSYRQLMTSRYQQSMLSIYQQVAANQSVEVDETMAQYELLQSGLVIAQNGQLKSANEIYRLVFSSLVTF